MVKNANNPIVQICKRLHELEVTEHGHEELIRTSLHYQQKQGINIFNLRIEIWE